MRKHPAQSVPTFYLDDVAVELAGVTGATGSGVVLIFFAGHNLA